MVTQKQPRIYSDKTTTTQANTPSLKTYHKTSTTAMMETRRMESMFSDNGLEWRLEKCATVTVSKGKLISAVFKIN